MGNSNLRPHLLPGRLGLRVVGVEKLRSVLVGLFPLPPEIADIEHLRVVSHPPDHGYKARQGKQHARPHAR
jgi:hypothetical protein